MEELFGIYFPIPPLSIWIVSGLTTFVVILLGIAGRNYLKASERFKEIIYTELKGIYPKIVVYIEPKKIEEQITNSIIPIKTGGEIFKDSLPSFCVGCFRRALDHYCETARKTNWDEQLALQKFHNSPTMPVYVKPKENLYKAVNDLLKFAK